MLGGVITALASLNESGSVNSDGSRRRLRGACSPYPGHRTACRSPRITEIRRSCLYPLRYELRPDPCETPVHMIRDGRQPSHLFASQRRMIPIRRSSRTGAAQLPNHVCGPASGRTMPEHGLTAHCHHAGGVPHRSVPVSASETARPATCSSRQCGRSACLVASAPRDHDGAPGRRCAGRP